MLNRLPPWLRATVISALQALAAGLLMILLDLLADVQDWVRDPTNPVDLSGAGTAAVLALFSFCTAVVVAVHRGLLNPPQNAYPEPPSDAGLLASQERVQRANTISQLGRAADLDE